MERKRKLLGRRARSPRRPALPPVPVVALPVPEVADVATLKPHPRNYRRHPDDELAHIAKSLEQHGQYRNVVAARDGTILAGHGVVEAAKRLGWAKLRIVRLDVGAGDPRALKILVGDNEIAHLAEVDDRALTEMLREIKDVALEGLFGTGYDEQMLAALAMVTRPASEIADFDAAAEWVGMPEYEMTGQPLKVIVQFRNKEDRLAFAEKLGLTFTDKTISAWWPPKADDDISSVQFLEH